MRGMFFLGALVVIEYHKELLLKPYGVREMHVRCLFFICFFLCGGALKELLMLMQYGVRGSAAAGSICDVSFAAAAALLL